MAHGLPPIGSRWQGGKSKRPPYGPTLWEVVGYREPAEWGGYGVGVVMKRLDDQAPITRPPGSTEVISPKVMDGYQPYPLVRATYRPWID